MCYLIFRAKITLYMFKCVEPYLYTIYSLFIFTWKTNHIHIKVTLYIDYIYDSIYAEVIISMYEIGQFIVIPFFRGIAMIGQFHNIDDITYFCINRAE